MSNSPWRVAYLFTTDVRGKPVTQGSMTAFTPRGSTGPPVVVHGNAATLKPWRTQIADALRGAKAHGIDFPLAGPVAVELTFTVAKPKAAPKRTRTWPVKQPDVDKLIRAVLDAMTESGVVADDAQVLRTSADKTYPNEHPDALEVPGVRIRIGRIIDPATDDYRPVEVAHLPGDTPLPARTEPRPSPAVTAAIDLITTAATVGEHRDALTDDPEPDLTPPAEADAADVPW